MQARSEHRYYWLKQYKSRPLYSAQIDANGRPFVILRWRDNENA